MFLVHELELLSKRNLPSLVLDLLAVLYDNDLDIICLMLLRWISHLSYLSRFETLTKSLYEKKNAVYFFTISLFVPEINFASSLKLFFKLKQYSTIGSHTNKKREWKTVHYNTLHYTPQSSLPTLATRLGMRSTKTSITCFIIQLSDSVKHISVTSAASLLIGADVTRLRITRSRVSNSGYLDFPLCFDHALLRLLQEL